MNKIFDIAVGESGGNGGDIQKVSNDIALVYGKENQVYLALFGGNTEGDTLPVDNINKRAKDFWANNLLFKNQPEKQFNSKTERTLNTTALNSAGRLRIETAVRDDLRYMVQKGAEVNVAVTFPGINTVKIEIRVAYTDGDKRVTVITFDKKGSDGDFSLSDFNDDFY